MKKIRINSWAEFDSKIEAMQHREWLFRGHSDASWQLTTSLDRMFEDVQPIIKNAKGTDRTFARKDHEKLIIKSFQKNANLYLSFLPSDSLKLEWLAIMQHYGAPTRLLDFTLSPHIAAYFALAAGSGECCVFAVNHLGIKKQNMRLVSAKTYKEIQSKIFTSNMRFIAVFDPDYGNERLVVQQGLFLVPSQVNVSFESILNEYQKKAVEDICVKFIIPPDLRLRGLERLREMNITSASLFPGIDGFCKALRFQALETVKSQKLFT
jgi:hypothetical protein